MKNFLNNLLEIFRDNDGSLPDIELHDLSGDEVIRGYNLLKGFSEKISSEKAYYWSVKEEIEIPITFNDNPSIKVVSGEAEPFHLCFDGITSASGKRVPELGLFVFEDWLSLDYRMGPEWNFEALQGLFEILYSLHQNSKSMKIVHRANINDDDGTIFKSAWEAYKSSK